MINSFTAKHPWLSKKLNRNLLMILRKINKNEFTTNIDRTNLKIIINPKDDSVGKAVLFGKYEPSTRKFIEKILSVGDHVVDVGANIGYFTLLFSHLVGDAGEVHSFEPSRREFFLLCKNVELNNKHNVYLNQVALGNINGFSKMNIMNDARYGAYNSINLISHPKVTHEKSHSENVRIMKLDSYLRLFPNLNPSLIKIDVEGFELEVFHGMENILKSNKSTCIIFEVCEATHQNSNKKIQDLTSFINNFGFLLFNPTSEGNLTPYKKDQNLNCVAITSEHLNHILYKKEIKIV